METDLSKYLQDPSSIPDLETKRLINIIKNIEKYPRIHPKIKRYLKLAKDELKVREGEKPGNPNNLTIQEIKANRNMNRLLLDVDPLESYETPYMEFPKPKESLFKK